MNKCHNFGELGHNKQGCKNEPPDKTKEKDNKRIKAGVENSVQSPTFDLVQQQATIIEKVLIDSLILAFLFLSFSLTLVVISMQPTCKLINAPLLKAMWLNMR